VKPLKKYMKWDFWKGDEEFDAVSVRRDRDAVAHLMDCPGWNYLAQELVSVSNGILEMWMKGGHDVAKHERLAGQVELIGKLLDLPNKKLRELDAQLVDEKEQKNPRVDPVDLDQMSPIPDESEWDDFAQKV
jgi:hypothetical protein